MRRSKEQTADTRQRIIKETATLIREKGLERASVANLMDAAGMTHGGFYKHFPSKDELVTEAIATIFREHHNGLLGDSEAQRKRAMRSYIEAYLSLGHIYTLGEGCAVAALASDVVKLSGAAQDAMMKGTKETINRLAELINQPKQEQRQLQAIELFCTLVGTIVVARALSGEPTIQEKVLKTMRKSQTVKRLLSVAE
jgi:TetR/AcrR family transcriptional regulator, transcriptional repressor for nem operon